MKRRKLWLAFSFSLLCPGLGQLYNGTLRAPLVALIIGTLLTAFSSVFLFDSLPKLLVALLLGLAFDLAFAVHAYRQAKELGEVSLRPFQRWYAYIGFAVLLYGLPNGYGYIIPERFLSFQIPSESMLPTLLVGDRLVADGWAYWGKEPQRGDIVVFNYPKDPGVKYVKRLVGVPGDRVELRGGELYLNGEQVKQERTGAPMESGEVWQQVEYVEKLGDVEHRIYRSQPPMFLDFSETTVPEGRYSMMGDNRDRSNDSRAWGFVRREEIVGRMVYIYFSWDAVAGRLRGERFGLQVR